MHQFDEMAKDLANGMSRRQAIRRVGAGLAGAMLASLGLAKAWSKDDDDDEPETCEDYCRKVVGINPSHEKQFGKCVSNCEQCIDHGGIACGQDNCCVGTEVCTSDLDGICEIPNPCVGQNGACLSDSDCCAGLSCLPGGYCGSLGPA